VLQDFFTPLGVYDQNWRGSGLGKHPKNLVATSNLVRNLGLGLAYQKQRLGPKLVESGLGEHPKKCGSLYLFLQPLKLLTSNLVHNLGLGSTLQ